MPSDPRAINNAMVAAHDTDPLIAWGSTPVDLQPKWVTWYDPATMSFSSKPTSLFPPRFSGTWDTTTWGQWVSPTDLGAAESLAQAAYLLYALQSGDTSALAPVLNWTAYLTNVNLIAYGNGAIAAGQAYQAFIDSAKGETHDGYDAVVVGDPLTGPRVILIDPNAKVPKNTVEPKTNLTASQLASWLTNIPGIGHQVPMPDPTPQPGVEVVKPGGVIDATLLSLILLRNPGRPNGGLYARFAPVYEQLTGANPVTPERQDVLPDGVDPELVAKLLNGDPIDPAELQDLVAALEAADGKPIVLTLKADATWEYDLLSDAPATANPVSWANSVASALFLTNLLTGINPANPETAPEGTVLKAYVVPTGQPDAGSIYITYAPNQLPLLAPLRLPTQLLSLATGQQINSPVADAIEPALKMLVDLGYTDVVRNPDGTYSRTLDQMHLYTPFASQAPLTPKGLLYVPGDFLTLLGKGIGTETSQELEQLATLLLSAASSNTPLDPNLKKLLDAPGDAIVTVSRAAGDATSTVLHTVGNPVIDAVPDIAGPASDLAQGTLPPKANQEVTQAIQSLPQGNLPQPGQGPLSQGQLSQGPLLNVIRGTANPATATTNQGPLVNAFNTGNPALGAQNGTPVKTAISNTHQQVQNTLNNVNTGVKNAVDGLKGALSGGQKPSSTSDGNDGDGAGQ